MDQAIAPGFSTGMPITRAGIDIALHDLTGKLQGQSLAEMWGREPGGPITLSWTVNVTKFDDVDRLMDEGRQRGYRNFNIKVAPISTSTFSWPACSPQCARIVSVGRCERWIRRRPL